MNQESSSQTEFWTTLASLAGAAAIIVTAPPSKGIPTAVLVVALAYAFVRFRHTQTNRRRDYRLIASLVVASVSAVLLVVALAASPKAKSGNSAGGEPSPSAAAPTPTPSPTQTPTPTPSPTPTPTSTPDAKQRVTVREETTSSVFDDQRLRLTVRAIEFAELDGGLQHFITRLVVRAPGADCTDWRTVAAGDLLTVRGSQYRYVLEVVNVDTFDATFDVGRAPAKRQPNQKTCVRR